MGFFAAVGSAYINILNFSDRASRAEYWWFFLFEVLFHIVYWAGFVAYALYSPEFLEYLNHDRSVMPPFLPWVLVSYVLFMMVPSTSIMVRRLHDSDHSGWWIFIGIAPLIGELILFFLLIIPGDPDRNRFGPVPYSRNGKVKIRLPQGMKPAPSEAERRAEILEYYRKNIKS